MPEQNAKPIRYAVVGAGWFGQEAVLPAFRNAKGNSSLAAIVSGDPTKRGELSKTYGVPSYPYSDMEDLFASGTLDAAYIVTPNAEHAGPAILAAKHGLNVLCEKPLARSAKIAEKIVLACDEAGVKLMTAYRLHFEKAHLTAIERIQAGAIGEPRLLHAVFTQTVSDGNVRLDPAQGGHPIMDLGVYCINAAGYFFCDEPLELIAYEVGRAGSKSGGVPDLVSAILKFPNDRLAQISAGFAQADVSEVQIVGSRGDLRLKPAFSYTGERTLSLTAEGKTRHHTFPAVDQIAAEIDYFSECIQRDREPEPDGREGLADLRIVEAVYASIQNGRAVPLQPIEKLARPSLKQHRAKPPHAKPELVNASPP